jgi:hypothetical protein
MEIKYQKTFFREPVSYMTEEINRIWMVKNWFWSMAAQLLDYSDRPREFKSNNKVKISNKFSRQIIKFHVRNSLIAVKWFLKVFEGL